MTRLSHREDQTTTLSYGALTIDCHATLLSSILEPTMALFKFRLAAYRERGSKIQIHELSYADAPYEYFSLLHVTKYFAR